MNLFFPDKVFHASRYGTQIYNTLHPPGRWLGGWVWQQGVFYSQSVLPINSCSFASPGILHTPFKVGNFSKLGSPLSRSLWITVERYVILVMTVLVNTDSYAEIRSTSWWWWLVEIIVLCSWSYSCVTTSWYAGVVVIVVRRSTILAWDFNKKKKTQNSE